MDEVAATAGIHPLVALRCSAALSEKVIVATAAGTPVMVFGVCRASLLDGRGTIWMLGTDAVSRHAREMLTDARVWLADLSEGFTSLENRVDCRNAASIRWLRRMGAKFGDSDFSGVERRLFMPFSIEVPRTCASSQPSQPLL